MPLRAYIPPGRDFYYLRGTVRAGKKSRSIFESAGIGKREPSAATRAEEIRLRRETEIYNELLYGPKRVVTFTENASDYCEKRNRDRVAENPALAGTPDKEAEYVAKWITFLRRRGLADIPLSEFCDERREETVKALAAYFREVHDAKGNALDTKQRESNVYCALMNHAVAKTWASPGFPRPELPAQDIFATPVNKWLYDEEIQLLVKSAGKKLKIFAAGVFATGIRGGEFLYISRRAPKLSDPLSTGLSLEPGHEFFYLGWTRTKNRKPIVRTIPDWYVAMLQTYLEDRTDQHDALILTPKNRPYKRPRRQSGFQVKTAWKAMRERAAKVVERLARRKLGRDLTREAARLMNRAAILRTVTPHWGRHNAASHIVRKGLGKHAAQKAAGWRSERMVERYLHLAPEYAKDLANTLDFGMGKVAAQSTGPTKRLHAKNRTA
jgi:integrase